MADFERSPRISWNVSFGNILTIIVMALGGAGVWFSVVNKTEAHGETLVKHDARISNLESVSAADRLKQTEILTEMQVDLRYMRQAIEGLQRRIDARPTGPP